MAKPRRVRFGWQRLFQVLLQAAFLLSAPGTSAGATDEETEAAQSGSQPASGPLPFRLEFGGYYSWVDRGFGDWRGLNAEFWWRGNARFVPAFLVDSQTRPAGTQQNYAFTSYINWRPSFYTTQSVSVAPQGSDLAIYFPKVRYDLKGHWKLRRDRNLVMAAGFTYFDFGRPGQGQIYNAGTIYYRGKLVLEGNFYLNRSQPGGLWSSSGSVAAQYGREGRYWAGVTFGGGKELYRQDALTPIDVRHTSYTIQVFYRRWLSQRVGYVAGATFQDKIDAYKRGGGWGRLFFEF